MGIHQQTHPEFVDGCFMCKASSVAVAPSATPSRGDGARSAEVNAKEKQWAIDHAAYRRLRHDGLHPRHIDGSSKLEGASDQFEINTGHLLNKRQRAEARVGIDAAQQIAAEAS